MYIELYPKSDELIARHRNKMLGEEPYIAEGSIVYHSHVGSWTEIGPNSTIVESTFGDYSYVAGDVQMIYAEVGKFCSIASHVRLNPGNHPMQRVTQHHMTYRRKQYGFGDDDQEIFDWRRSNKVVVGHDVWIGHAAIVMPGVCIDTGAVVGSNAVVTKDVGPFEIVVGVPAKPIRKRFPDHIIEKLLQIAWWEWDRPTLEARFDDLMEIETFIEKYG